MQNIDIRSLLLDSSLISQTSYSHFTTKIVDLGDIFQLYFYNEDLIRKDKNKEIIETKDYFKDCFDFSLKKTIEETQIKEIRYDNIIRSRLLMQRIIQANMKEWRTFITLTYKDNILSLKQAHKDLNIFLTKIRKLKKDFKYLVVPEFQKRGAVHYHILSNLTIENDYNIIKKQKNTKNCYDMIHWKKGYTAVFQFPINFNIVGYLTKYLSKNIDSRYYSKKRYYNSHNLKLPHINYIDLSTEKGKTILKETLSDSKIKYHNRYYSIYNGGEIHFIEIEKNR